jgi:hypothetical protein
MDRLIPLAMAVIAASILAITAKLLLRSDCCCQNQPATSTALFDSVMVVPGDTIVVVPGDSIIRRRAGQATLVVAPGRAAVIRAR